MPVPTPTEGESQSDFVSRCMSSMVDEFPDQSQRAAVCHDALGKSAKFSIEQIRKWCPGCANYMQASGMNEITLEDFRKFFHGDARKICSDIWENGGQAQRTQFGIGTEGRNRGEKPPKRWWADCLIRAGN